MIVLKITCPFCGAVMAEVTDAELREISDRELARVARAHGATARCGNASSFRLVLTEAPAAAPIPTLEEAERGDQSPA